MSCVVTYLHAKKHIIWMRTKQEQRIPAFYIDRRSPVTILFSHGNAEDIGMIYEWYAYQLINKSSFITLTNII